MLKPVLKMGNPQLLKIAEAVQDIESTAVQAVIEDMLDTMRALNGAGLAAPQIGINWRIVMFEITQNPRYPEATAIPFTVLINPQIEPLSDQKVYGWEGCLSIPGLRGYVPRYQHICYSGYDAQGVLIKREVTDFHARVVQHECDHLDGVLFSQRVTDNRLLGFTDQLFPNDFSTPPAILTQV